jgi:hypothetical protein
MLAVRSDIQVRAKKFVASFAMSLSTRWLSFGGAGLRTKTATPSDDVGMKRNKILSTMRALTGNTSQSNAMRTENDRLAFWDTQRMATESTGASARAKATIATLYLLDAGKEGSTAPFARSFNGSSTSTVGQDDKQFIVPDKWSAFSLWCSALIAGIATRYEILRRVIRGVEIEMISHDRARANALSWHPFQFGPAPMARMRAGADLVVEHHSANGNTTRGWGHWVANNLRHSMLDPSLAGASQSKVIALL